jgi:hypothetical protein
MGVSYSAKIVVGLPFCAIPNAQELLDDDKISDFGYYYDCDEDDRLVGVQVASSGDYSYSEFRPESSMKIAQAMNDFWQIAGLDGRTYLTVCSH